EQHLAADAKVVLLVDPVAGGDVEDRAAAAGRGNCEPRGYRVRQRAGDRRLGLLEAEAPDSDLGAALEGEGRLVGRDVDRARRGVLAVERALRTAQDLDLGHVEE